MGPDSDFNIASNKIVIVKALQDAHDQLHEMEKELELREKLFKEFREAKEQEIADLMKIKSDLEVCVQ